jgi:hypothetical protein
MCWSVGDGLAGTVVGAGDGRADDGAVRVGAGVGVGEAVTADADRLGEALGDGSTGDESVADAAGLGGGAEFPQALTMRAIPMPAAVTVTVDLDNGGHFTGRLPTSPIRRSVPRVGAGSGLGAGLGSHLLVG